MTPAKHTPDPASTGTPTVPGPIHVPSLNDGDRADLMKELRDWVVELVTRFDISIRAIPPCWDQHNGMVEALAALRDLERDCYGPKAPPGAAVDWFRGLREIEGRLIEIASLTNCSGLEHRKPPPGWPHHRPLVVPYRECERHSDAM